MREARSWAGGRGTRFIPDSYPLDPGRQLAGRLSNGEGAIANIGLARGGGARSLKGGRISGAAGRGADLRRSGRERCGSARLGELCRSVWVSVPWAAAQRRGTAVTGWSTGGVLPLGPARTERATGRARMSSGSDKSGSEMGRRVRSRYAGALRNHEREFQ